MYRQPGPQPPQQGGYIQPELENPLRNAPFSQTMHPNPNVYIQQSPLPNYTQAAQGGAGMPEQQQPGGPPLGVMSPQSGGPVGPPYYQAGAPGPTMDQMGVRPMHRQISEGMPGLQRGIPPVAMMPSGLPPHASPQQQQQQQQQAKLVNKPPALPDPLESFVCPAVPSHLTDESITALTPTMLCRLGRDIVAEIAHRTTQEVSLFRQLPTETDVSLFATRPQAKTCEDRIRERKDRLLMIEMLLERLEFVYAQVKMRREELPVQLKGMDLIPTSSNAEQFAEVSKLREERKATPEYKEAHEKYVNSSEHLRLVQGEMKRAIDFLRQMDFDLSLQLGLMHERSPATKSLGQPVMQQQPR